MRRKKVKLQLNIQDRLTTATLLPFTLWVYLLLFSFCLGAAPVSFAKDEPLTDDTVRIKTEGSHRLLLPSDWAVEHKDGRFAPVPIEEYLSMKFGQVREKFSDADQRLDALERRLDQVEQENKALLKGLRVLGEQVATQEGNHGHTPQGQ